MTGVYDIGRILQLIPHRYPFLLVDRILELDRRKRVVGVKCVSANEPFFQGHFPGLPVMPGVLIIEALAQVAAVLIMSELEDPRQKISYFAGIDECRFRRPVIPGDVVRLEADVIHLRPRAARMKAVATVDGEVVAEAVLLSTMADRSDR